MKENVKTTARLHAVRIVPRHAQVWQPIQVVAQIVAVPARARARVVVRAAQLTQAVTVVILLAPEHVKRLARETALENVPMVALEAARVHVLASARPPVRLHVPMIVRADARNHVLMDARTAARTAVRPGVLHRVQEAVPMIVQAHVHALVQTRVIAVVH